MDVLGRIVATLVACAVPLAPIAFVAVWAGRAAERFFAALAKTPVAERPQEPSIRFRPSLGDLAFGKSAHYPGLEAALRHSPNPEVERLRKVAARAGIGYFASVPLALVLAVVASAALGAPQMATATVTLFGWDVGQYPAFRHHLWASRPEVRDVQSLTMHAYALAGLMVAITLTAAFGLVGPNLLIRGG